MARLWMDTNIYLIIPNEIVTTNWLVMWNKNILMVQLQLMCIGKMLIMDILRVNQIK